MPTLDQYEIRWVNPFIPETEGLSHKAFHSSILDDDIGFGIYIPPDYGKNKKRYRTIYWLHGKGGDEGEGQRCGIVKTLDNAIRSGDIESIILILVNGTAYSMYADFYDGSVPAETTFIKELIPHIDNNYLTLATPSGRCIEGFSMGGNGALKIALKYPGVFSSAVSCGGSFHDLDSIMSNRKEVFQKVFSSNKNYYQENSCFTLAEKNITRISKGLRIRFIVGDKDFTLESNLKIWKSFDFLGIKYEKLIIKGLYHDCRSYIKETGVENLRFHLGG